MSITVVDGSCLLSCYFNGNLMPNPAPFLWTVVPVNLTSCKLVEHTLAVPMSSSQMWMLWTDLQVSTVWEFVYILPIGPSLIIFKVVIKKPNSSLSHTQKKNIKATWHFVFSDFGFVSLNLERKKKGVSQERLPCLGHRQHSCEHWILTQPLPILSSCKSPVFITGFQVGRDLKDHLVQYFVPKAWSRQDSTASCPVRS